MTDPAQKSVLSNGLRVVTVELPHLHTGMIAAYVRAGSRHENPAQNGPNGRLGTSARAPNETAQTGGQIVAKRRGRWLSRWE